MNLTNLDLIALVVLGIASAAVITVGSFVKVIKEYKAKKKEQNGALK